MASYTFQGDRVGQTSPLACQKRRSLSFEVRLRSMTFPMIHGGLLTETACGNAFQRRAGVLHRMANSEMSLSVLKATARSAWSPRSSARSQWSHRAKRGSFNCRVQRIPRADVVHTELSSPSPLARVGSSCFSSTKLETALQDAPWRCRRNARPARRLRLRCCRHRHRGPQCVEAGPDDADEGSEGDALPSPGLLGQPRARTPESQ